MNKFSFFRILFLFLILQHLCSDILSQVPPLYTPVDIHKNVIPPTPDVSIGLNAAFGRVNNNTGAVSADIPLHVLKVGDITFPVSLSYYSQGNRVDEGNSRAGFGWSLNAASVITRTIRGLPDELYPFKYTMAIENSLSELTKLNYDYFKAASESTPMEDYQFDEYYFSVEGFSGKFIVNASNVVITTEKTDLKIQPVSGKTYFIITTPRGLKYHFGHLYKERIKDLSVSGNNTSNEAYSALFLFQIESPNGDYINFDYTPITTKAVTANTQTYIKHPPTSSFLNTSKPGCDDCPNIPGTLNEHKVETMYFTYYLSTIYASNGDQIYFGYEPVGDNSNEVRLKHVTASNSSWGTYNSYTMDYIDVNSSPYLGAVIGYKRFFLSRIKKNVFVYGNLLINNAEPEIYDIDYYDLYNTSMPYSRAKDYAGFFNGKHQNSLLVDHPFFSPGTGQKGDRTPSATYAMKGILKSIKYPSGMVEEYMYEGNEVIFDEDVGPPWFPYFNTGLYEPGKPRYFTGEAIEIFNNQTATISLHSYPKYPEQVNDINGIEKVVAFEFYENNTRKDSIVMFRANATNPLVIQKNLQAGKYYRFDINMANNAEIEAYVMFQYFIDTASPYLERRVKSIPGIRLSEIKYYNNTEYSKSKFYTYKHFGAWNYGSGAVISPKDLFRETEISILCTILPHVEMPICKYHNFRAPELNDYLIYNNSVIFYGAVIESDSKTFKNGGIEYSYYGPGNGDASLPFWGNVVPELPTNNYASMNGRLRKVLRFDSSLNILSEVEDLYSESIMPGSYSRNLLVTRNYEPAYFGDTYLDISFRAFNVIQYFYASTIIRKTKTIKKERTADGKLLTTETLYSYNNNFNNQPSLVISVDSKGDTNKVYNYYSSDFLYDTLLKKKFDRNEIHDPVKIVNFKGDRQIQEVLYNYKFQLVKPYSSLLSSVLIKYPPMVNYDTAVIHHKYDSKGNILETEKEKGLFTSYLWGYAQQYPIAEVVNARHKNIFYTSFEDAHYSSGNNFTGLRSSLSGLDTTLTALDAGKYTLSYWKYQSGKWDLIKETITLSGNSYRINITGTIDEVRFYPENAFMTTYTYLPGAGVLGSVDANNKKVTYVYDQNKRISFVMDHEGNIIRKVCYNLYGQLEDCSGIETFFSDSVGKFVVKNNCAPGGVGDSVLISLPFGFIRSVISPQDATLRANAYIDSIGQSYANVNGGCTWYNDEISRTYTKTCAPGYISSSHVYTVPANKYSSRVSRSHAESLASQELFDYGQLTADSLGTCTLICTTGNCSGSNRRCVNNTCEFGVEIQIDCEFDPETNKYKHWYVYQFSDMSWSTPWYVIRPYDCPM
jgi:hypothetical protein